MAAVSCAGAAYVASDVGNGVGGYCGCREGAVYEWDAKHVVAITQRLRGTGGLVKTYGGLSVARNTD